MVTYSEKLRDPRWQRVRLQVWERANFCCESCGNGKRSLEVHHCYYEKGKEPWEYPLTCFLLLCERCHDEWHDRKLAIDKSLAGMCEQDLDRVAGLIAGLDAATNGLDVYIPADDDALRVAAIVRGFWPPTLYQARLIDAAVTRLANRVDFWLSDIVAECIPIDDPEFRFIANWYETATDKRERGDCV